MNAFNRVRNFFWKQCYPVTWLLQKSIRKLSMTSMTSSACLGTKKIKQKMEKNV